LNVEIWQMTGRYRYWTSWVGVKHGVIRHGFLTRSVTDLVNLSCPSGLLSSGLPVIQRDLCVIFGGNLFYMTRRCYSPILDCSGTFGFSRFFRISSSLLFNSTNN
jgi:hypothetical protein